ncbi:hypothetical protein GCM10009850_072180 [Nonomuraea monospora]|uniref:Ricin B lectin domain-containing protein n=2 Tax=Nonomuraea monospora TaxID=568818 RepID=A0ABN3CQN3_9ACTN
MLHESEGNHMTRIRKTTAAVMVAALATITGPPPAHAAATFYLHNLKSHKNLQPLNGNPANGARIVQQPENPLLLAQRWSWIAAGAYDSLHNAGTGKNLGIDGASTALGALAIQANPSNDYNQDWLVLFEGYPEGYFALKNRKSGMCLGISMGSTANGGQAAQFPCDGSPNQGWTTYPQ